MKINVHLHIVGSGEPLEWEWGFIKGNVHQLHFNVKKLYCQFCKDAWFTLQPPCVAPCVAI